MPGFYDYYDVAVVGAGHAGIEAALAAARMGLKTVLITQTLVKFALRGMSRKMVFVKPKIVLIILQQVRI